MMPDPQGPSRPRAAPAGSAGTLGTPDRSAAARTPFAEAEPEVIDPETQRLHAMLPPALLQEGEIIILLIKPSLWFVPLSCLGHLLMFMLITAGALWLERFGLLHVSRSDILLVGAGLIGARLLWQFFEWASRVYVLTDRRVIRVKGVLRVSVFETQLKQIQHTATFFSLRERFFALGTITFATAGTFTIEAMWEMISRPLEVHRVVVQALNRYR